MLPKKKNDKQKKKIDFTIKNIFNLHKQLPT